MAFLEKSRTQQIEDALKRNASSSKRAEGMLRNKNVDKEIQRFLVEDRKRMVEERKMLNKMLEETKRKKK